MQRALIITASILVSSRAAAAGPAVYTPTAGVFNSTDFNAWLMSSYLAGYAPLICAAGSYAVPAPTAATQGAHVFLNGTLTDVIVDMSGVTLIMQDRASTAVLVSGWTNVTLRGLTSVYAELPSNQAHILDISSDGTAYDVQVPQGYPLADWLAGATLSCNVFDAGTWLWKAGTWDLYAVNITTISSANQTFHMTFGSNYGPSAMNVAVGDVLGCRAARFAFTFHVSGNENCTFEDVTLFGGPGFGYFADGANVPGARGGNTYRRVSIRAPPAPSGATEPPLIATSADGFHMAGVPRGPVIDSCYFERMTDDGIAIHGSYRVVTGANFSSNSVWVVSDDYTPGDTLRLYDATIARVGVFTITAVADAAPGYVPPRNVSNTLPRQAVMPPFKVLTLAEALPASVAFDFIVSNADRTGNGFVITNTTIHWHRARGMLIKASSGRIVGNTVMGSTMGALIITPEVFWAEADFAHDLFVANNTFEYVGYGMQSYGGVAVGAIGPGGGFPAAGGHVNITLVNNVWRNISYTNLWISSSLSVTVANNSFEQPFASPAWAQCCEPVPTNVTVYATESANLTLAGNCVYGAPGNASILDVSASVTGTGLSDGVVPC